MSVFFLTIVQDKLTSVKTKKKTTTTTTFNASQSTSLFLFLSHDKQMTHSLGGKPHLFKNFYQPLDLTLQKFTFHWIHLILGKYICWSHQQIFFAVMAGNLSIFFVSFFSWEV